MCSRSNKFVWSKEITQDLCLLYENHPVLYCTYAIDYKNKNKRNNALTQIKQDLVERHSFVAAQTFTIEDIKTKIHGLRTQFFKEYNKIKCSKTSGRGTDEIEKPKLWCYDLLKFLVNTAPIRPTTSSIEEDIPVAEEEEEEIIFEGSIDDMEMLPALEEHETTQTTLTSSNNSTPAQKGKRKNNYEDVRQLIGAAAKRLECLSSKAQVQDDIYMFGMSVAEELRKIKDATRLRKVKRTIFNSLMDAQDEENV